MPPPGIEPATPCFLACPSNHSAIGRYIDMLLELLQYFLIKRCCINYVSCARDIKKIKMYEHCSLTVLCLKSSMTFIQTNGCTEIDLILKQIWRRFIWRQVSFKHHLPLLTIKFVRLITSLCIFCICPRHKYWLLKSGKYSLPHVLCNE